eukprot:m.28441 g.28441  ORF g.28441 m.28441 type:complete len:116 (+) comp10273_c0_seq1:58-405(+)
MSVVLHSILAKSPVAIFSKNYCPYCQRLLQLVSGLNVPFRTVELTSSVTDSGVTVSGEELQGAIKEEFKHRTVPALFIGGKLIGGFDSSKELHDKGQLKPMMEKAIAASKPSGDL